MNTKSKKIIIIILILILISGCITTVQSKKEIKIRQLSGFDIDMFQNIEIVHDDLRNSTCYVYIGNGLSCIADSQLDNQEP